MANRRKTERNEKIYDRWFNRGWRQKSIANEFKMTETAVRSVIHRERARRRQGVVSDVG